MNFYGELYVFNPVPHDFPKLFLFDLGGHIISEKVFIKLFLTAKKIDGQSKFHRISKEKKSEWELTLLKCMRILQKFTT